LEKCYSLLKNLF